MAEGFSDIVPGGDFPPATREMWEERARATLKGRPLRSLWAETPEGIAIPPVCAADEVAPLPLPPRPRPLVAQGGWAILQRIDHPDVDGARAQIAEELAMGAHGLVLVVADAPGADGWGLLPDEVPAVLDDVDCEHMPLRLDAGPHWHAAAGALLDLAAGRHYELSRSPWLLAVDPLGAAASSGRLPERAPLARRLAALLEWAAALGLKRAVLAADGRPWHAAGCGDAQQLGILLAATAEYLRLLREGGMAPADVAPRIAWLLAVDAGQFTTIAALRAARLLHARLLEVLEVPFAPLPLLAESAWRMMTRRDPWVNMLRTTSAAFAAGLGSADAVTLLPFTHALGLADPFARRMARNMQIIAREEASLHRVEDPLAGSAWVETATRALCERAWRVFADIEAAGGLHAALAAGSLREMIEEIAARRRRDVATRRLPITGVSAYPALEERRPDVLDLPRRPSPP
ncbi:MAG TPA: methylmalonyl-CoA mutase, partial [Thermopetrobacter sp.]|nr:methylmalonyl-CoA mutase [Thermopetrobacter sp.]